MGSPTSEYLFTCIEIAILCFFSIEFITDCDSRLESKAVDPVGDYFLILRRLPRLSLLRSRSLKSGDAIKSVSVCCTDKISELRDFTVFKLS